MFGFFLFKTQYLKNIILLFLIFSTFFSIAQNSNESAEKLKALRLACLDDDISDELLRKNNALFTRALKGYLESPNQIIYLDSIPYFSHLKSPDKVFDIFNWNLSYEDGSYEYFCLLRLNETSEIIEFTDNSDKFYNPETKKLSSKDWFGALYYEIIPVKDKPTYYLLLGWDGNNNFTTKKIIETLNFENENINFGIPVFESENGTKNRVIFEFSKSAVMSLRYQEKEKRIVFDHLAPFQEGADDFFEFYGPDLSFDAYQFKKGNWSYIKEVDVRAPNKMDNYIDPRKTRK